MLDNVVDYFRASNAYLVLKTLKPVGSMLQSRSYLISAYSSTPTAVKLKDLASGINII